MNRLNRRVQPIAVGVLLAAMTLTLSAQEPAGRPGGEAVKVHGHWAITVRNADGSIASKHEFANSLQGPDMLAKLLAGKLTVGRLRIALQITYVTNDVSHSTIDPGAGGPGNDLVARTIGNVIELTGSIRQDNVSGIAAFVSHASTYVECVGDRSRPDGCQVPYFLFTQRDLTQPEPPSTERHWIQIVTGQIVDVTVVISFAPTH